MKDLTQPVGAEPTDDLARVRYQANPFWDDLTMDIRRKRTKVKTEDPKVMMNIRTGEQEGVLEVSTWQDYEADQFIKVYLRHLNVFFDISKNGQKLFEYALCEAGRNKNRDAIFLHPKDTDKFHKAMGRSGFSQASFYRAADELCRLRILGRSDVSWRFFINPQVFWNGSRVRFITELRKLPEVYRPGEIDPTGSVGIDFAEFDDGEVLKPFADEDEDE